MIQADKKTLYYVTGNPSKVSLFSQFIPADGGFRLEQVALDLFEEQTEDQEKIALSKAHQAWEAVKKPVLVDEVGIYFHKYKNFPGAFTKYVFKGLGFEGIAKLLDEGDEMSKLLVAVLMYGPGQYKLFSVRDFGTFKNLGDWPYDPHAPFDAVFVPHGCEVNATALAHQNPKLYNEKYVRARAMKDIVKFIAEQHVL